MLSSNIVFDKLSVEDLADLTNISKRTFYDAFASGNNPDDLEAYLNTTFSEENLTKELLNPLSEFYLARLEGRPIAYFKVNLGDAQTGLREEDGMELERIYVIQEYQNRKIGQTILDTVIEMAVQRKMRYLWLGVWEKNEKAINFYLRNNFEISGTHPYTIGNDRQTDKIMKLCL